MQPLQLKVGQSLGRSLGMMSNVSSLLFPTSTRQSFSPIIQWITSNACDTLFRIKKNPNQSESRISVRYKSILNIAVARTLRNEIQSDVTGSNDLAIFCTSKRMMRYLVVVVVMVGGGPCSVSDTLTVCLINPYLPHCFLLDHYFFLLPFLYKYLF